ncbi:MAG: hypothetical protein Q9184_005050 [Pyrenodesmia sp. 2 TL-2023]
MPPMKGSGMKWDPAADASLFKCVLKVHDIKPNYGELAKEMKELGYDCTPKALTHRIGNIRKATGAPADASASDAVTTPGNSPMKAKPGKAAKSTTTTAAAASKAQKKDDAAAAKGKKEKNAAAKADGAKGGGKRKRLEMGYAAVNEDEEEKSVGSGDGGEEGEEIVKGEDEEDEEDEEEGMGMGKMAAKRVKLEDVEDEEV